MNQINFLEDVCNSNNNFCDVNKNSSNNSNIILDQNMELEQQNSYENIQFFQENYSHQNNQQFQLKDEPNISNENNFENNNNENLIEFDEQQLNGVIFNDQLDQFTVKNINEITLQNTQNNNNINNQQQQMQNINDNNNSYTPQTDGQEKNEYTYQLSEQQHEDTITQQQQQQQQQSIYKKRNDSESQNNNQEQGEWEQDWSSPQVSENCSCSDCDREKLKIDLQKQDSEELLNLKKIELQQQQYGDYEETPDGNENNENIQQQQQPQQQQQILQKQQSQYEETPGADEQDIETTEDCETPNGEIDQNTCDSGSNDTKSNSDDNNLNDQNPNNSQQLQQDKGNNNNNQIPMSSDNGQIIQDIQQSEEVFKSPSGSYDFRIENYVQQAQKQDINNNQKQQSEIQDVQQIEEEQIVSAKIDFQKNFKQKDVIENAENSYDFRIENYIQKKESQKQIQQYQQQQNSQEEEYNLYQKQEQNNNNYIEEFEQQTQQQQKTGYFFIQQQQQQQQYQQQQMSSSKTQILTNNSNNNIISYEQIETQNNKNMNLNQQQVENIELDIQILKKSSELNELQQIKNYQDQKNNYNNNIDQITDNGEQICNQDYTNQNYTSQNNNSTYQIQNPGDISQNSNNNNILKQQKFEDQIKRSLQKSIYDQIDAIDDNYIAENKCQIQELLQLLLLYKSTSAKSQWIAGDFSKNIITHKLIKIFKPELQYKDRIAYYQQTSQDKGRNTIKKFENLVLDPENQGKICEFIVDLKQEFDQEVDQFGLRQYEIEANIDQQQEAEEPQNNNNNCKNRKRGIQNRQGRSAEIERFQTNVSRKISCFIAFELLFKVLGNQYFPNMSQEYLATTKIKKYNFPNDIVVFRQLNLQAQEKEVKKLQNVLKEEQTKKVQIIEQERKIYEEKIKFQEVQNLVQDTFGTPTTNNTNTQYNNNTTSTTSTTFDYKIKEISQTKKMTFLEGLSMKKKTKIAEKNSVNQYQNVQGQYVYQNLNNNNLF